ncbi:MAG: M23 family metallopeptidase [Chloroflexota bacterium]
MQKFNKGSKFIGLLLAGLLLTVLVGTLTFLSGGLGSSPQSNRLTGFVPATLPPQLAVQPYAQIDPAIVAYLNTGAAGAQYAGALRDIQWTSIQPIGVYLPAGTGERIQVGVPTVQPTPLPYATAPPLPLPFVPDNLPPTVSPFTEDGTPRTLPYDGSGECAPSGRPVDGVLTQRFHAYHGGIDIGIPLGTPVVATHSGEVTFAGWSEVGYGYLVILQSGGFITYYAHNTSFNVAEGQFVGKGSIIAWSGSTGNSTGPHVHYEVRINNVPVDPLTFESRGYGTC